MSTFSVRAKLGNWLRGIQDERLTRMKWGFLLMAGLSVDSFIGTSAHTATAPLAGLTWLVGTALFIIATVIAIRRMGLRFVGQYLSEVHGVRRFLLVVFLLWAVSIAATTLVRFFVGIMRDNTALDRGYDNYLHKSPTVVFLIATAILVILSALLGRSALNTAPAISREPLLGPDFATKEDHLAALKERYSHRPSAPEIAGVRYLNSQATGR